MALTWTVGQRITASRLNLRVPVTITKGADTARTSTATLAADPELVLTIKAGLSCILLGQLHVVSAANAAGDFQYGWSWTNSATVYMGSMGAHNTLASGSSADGEWAYRVADATSPSAGTPYGCSTGDTSVRVNDRIVAGGSDVTLTLIWAQGVSNANSTTLKANSYITAIPIG